MMKKLIFILISVIVLAVFLIDFDPEPAEEFYYIATLDGVRIPLDEYKLYLREQIITFEAIGGQDIWKTTLDGVSSQVLAKQNALDSIIFVKLTLSYADNVGVHLTEENRSEALLNAQTLFDSFSPEEAAQVDFGVIVNVMEESILQERVFEELTSNYASLEESIEVFNHIYDLWLQEAVIEKNVQIWDSIVIP